MKVARSIGAGGLLLAGLVPLLGCSTNARPAAAPAAAPVAPPGEPVELVAQRGTFENRIMLTGELQAVRADPIIVPRTPAWQVPIRWMIEDGTAVTAGQKVIELDNTQFASELEQKRLQVDAALNQLNQKKADLAVELADKEFRVEEARIRLEKSRLEADIPPELLPLRNYQEKVLAREKTEVAYTKAVEERDASRKAADSQLEELRIALERARYEVKTAEDAIASLTLHAPRDGILVVAQNRNEGRKYQVGDNAHVGSTVMQIPDLTEMKVEANLSDVDDGRIEVGMRGLSTLDTYPDTEFAGTVVDISPVATEQGWGSLRRAFRVVLELDEADPERMRPGMSVRVAVLSDRREDALLVARTAIDSSLPEGGVRLASGETAPIKLGPCNSQVCVVEEGLDDGTRLMAAR